MHSQTNFLTDKSLALKRNKHLHYITNTVILFVGSLRERLRTLAGDNLDLIPHELMSKYIAYARQVTLAPFHKTLTPFLAFKHQFWH